MGVTCPRCGALWLPRSRDEDGDGVCWRCGFVLVVREPARWVPANKEPPVYNRRLVANA